MPDKELCKRLYRDLITYMDFSISDDTVRRDMWYENLQKLKDEGCWWHYELVLLKHRRFMEKERKYWDQYVRDKRRRQKGRWSFYKEC